MYFILAGKTFSSGPPSTSVTNYAPLTGFDTTWFSSETMSRISIAPVAFEIKNLYIELTTAPGVGKNYTFTLRKNGVDTAMTLTISDTNTSGSYSAGAISFAAGDTFILSATPSGTPASTGYIRVSSLGHTISSQSQAICGNTGTIDAASTIYIHPGGSAGTVITTESSRQLIVTQPGTIDMLYTGLTTAPGAGKSAAFMVRKNTADTTLTCTIADAATTANDTSHSISVVAGDLISLKITPSGTPTTSTCSFSMRFTPTTPGYSIYGSAIDASWSNTVNNYGPPLSGGTGGITTDDANKRVVGAFLLKNFYVSLNTSPGLGKSYTASLRVNGSDSTLSKAISDSNTSGNITSDVQLQSTDTVLLAVAPSGTPSAISLVNIGWSAFFPDNSSPSASVSPSASRSPSASLSPSSSISASISPSSSASSSLSPSASRSPSSSISASISPSASRSPSSSLSASLSPSSSISASLSPSSSASSSSSASLSPSASASLSPAVFTPTTSSLTITKTESSLTIVKPNIDTLNIIE